MVHDDEAIRLLVDVLAFELDVAGNRWDLLGAPPGA
ncbi:hypothetical protein CLV56_1972 [Mumia flava]|uniref:Uncharacterized protein n=1 Tax=Mumia flava TaxID=1348852 RepID=A0A2M9BIK3_9ACTN|nr:hypothetical protein CLV56_1972 [Mumia flava]